MPLRHDPDELRRMASHIAYEVIRMWNWAIPDLGAANLPAAVTADRPMVALRLNQAKLESGLIHLRNVAAFLVKPGQSAHELDVTADDYFDDGWTRRPSAVLGDDDDAHLETMNELHRRLAHISKHRLDDSTKPGGFNWVSVLQLTPRVHDAVSSFLNDLGAAHPERAKWFLEPQ